MKICVINKSTVVSGEDARTMTHVVAQQVREHGKPTWNLDHATVRFGSTAAIDEFPMYLLDSADVAGALGYHDEDPQGRPYGRVFAKTVLDHGGQVLTTANSVSACLSHEMLELMGDPNINLWADNGAAGEYAVELCDPVEMDSYDIDHVAVSNFVLPAYFDHLSPIGTKLDYLGKLQKPFSMTKNGYLIIRKGGTVSQVFGEKYPEWRRQMKTSPASRTYKRSQQGAS